ncbi:MAG: mevalonate kinase [Candidatus Diapherotrites archaeon]|nr:mevalonate kinase [Candidatus Diapherotrites archaeon]
MAVEVSAPAKAILFGEHAVVYRKPAIAIPLSDLRARAVVRPASDGITISAKDFGKRYNITHSPIREGQEGYALQQAVLKTLEHIGVKPQDLVLEIKSDIPIASGLGSGAAVATAIVKAVAKFHGKELTDDNVNKIVYEIEQIHHGTPSGIDNTTIVYERPVYFKKRVWFLPNKTKHLKVGATMHFVIADTGIRAETKGIVADVRSAWKADKKTFNRLFNDIKKITKKARKALKNGSAEEVGKLMNENHALLEKMGVSSPEINALVQAARKAGAYGSKMSGAGRGGNIITIVPARKLEAVVSALKRVGAEHVYTTTLRKTS